jgi:hypothetical protein
MIEYEYRVVPAPSRGKRARGVKGPDGRFANAVQGLMNELAAEGWEYLRSDTLPNEERTGLTSFQTTFRSILVFRRPLAAETAQPAPQPDTEEAPFMPKVVTSQDHLEEEGDAALSDNVLPIALLQRARQVGDDASDDDSKQA